jgi:hypothetical protein
METMIKEYLFTLLRNLLAPLFVWAIAHGYVTDSQVTALILAVTTIVVAVVWGLINKFLWKTVTKEALAQPATTSASKLDTVIAGKVPSN